MRRNITSYWVSKISNSIRMIIISLRVGRTMLLTVDIFAQLEACNFKITQV